MAAAAATTVGALGLVAVVALEAEARGRRTVVAATVAATVMVEGGRADGADGVGAVVAAAVAGVA